MTKIATKRDTWTILSAIEWTHDYFKQHEIETPRLDAELLLAHVLGVERIQLYINFDKPLYSRELDQFKQIILRRAKREPIAYITGQKEFWSLAFKVSPDVLIPRPETELLVQILLDLRKRKEDGLLRQSPRSHKAKCTVLDIGAGCGNIAISLVREMPGFRILASDISSEAIKLAQENARFYGVDGNLSCWQGDLFEPFYGTQLEGKVDFVVSNPPYIPTDQLAGLPPEVGFEPRLALDGGIDGTSVQVRIIEESLRFLIPGGYLIMETGVSQANHLMQLGREDSRWADFRVVPDYSGLSRVILGRKC
jgi:release factor glutamine methyltransferase